MGALLVFTSICLFCNAAAHAAGHAASNDPAGATDAVLHIDISLFDGVMMSPAALAEVRYELERTLATIGVRVSWIDRVASPEHRAQSFELRAVIVPLQPTLWGFRPRAMGAVLSLEPPHTVFVFFPTIVRTVKRLEGSHYGKLGAGCHLVARGIARVLAHEILHMLAPDIPHTQNGIMKRALDRNDLLLREPLIDPIFASAFRQGLLVANLAHRGSRSVTAAPSESRKQ